MLKRLMRHTGLLAILITPFLGCIAIGMQSCSTDNVVQVPEITVVGSVSSSVAPAPAEKLYCDETNELDGGN